MKKPLLKIYGERNTGTNYLKKLIALNLDVDILPGVIPKGVWLLQKIMPGKELIRDLYFALTYSRNLGWKHTIVKPNGELQKCRVCSGELAFVTLTKNPYSWLLSLYNRPYHLYIREQMNFVTFLTSPWRTVHRENAKDRALLPIDMWNKKNLSYLSLNQGFPTLNIRFEDLLADPERIIRLISDSFSLDLNVEQFRNYNQSTKGEKKDSNYYRDYYLNERWKEKLTSQAYTIINERLDDRVMNHFEYERLSS